MENARSPDEAAARISSGQQGLLTQKQWQFAGLSSDQMDQRVRNGTYLRLTRGHHLARWLERHVRRNP